MLRCAPHNGCLACRNKLCYSFSHLLSSACMNSSVLRWSFGCTSAFLIQILLVTSRTMEADAHEACACLEFWPRSLGAGPSTCSASSGVRYIYNSEYYLGQGMFGISRAERLALNWWQTSPAHPAATAWPWKCMLLLLVLWHYLVNLDIWNRFTPASSSSLGTC